MWLQFEPKNGALAMGNDVVVLDCTLEDAFRKCLTLDDAVGFTFAPTAAVHGGRLRTFTSNQSAVACVF